MKIFGNVLFLLRAYKFCNINVNDKNMNCGTYLLSNKNTTIRSLVIIIMFIFKCYFSREHITCSVKHSMNIKLRKPFD